MVILGRTVRWNDWGISYEGNEKYRIKVLEKFGFDESTRPLTSNGDREDKEDEGEDAVPLDKKETKEFRSVAAKLNYMSQDGPDLQFPIKSVTTQMARPTRGSWTAVKKVARYLIGRQNVV